MAAEDQVVEGAAAPKSKKMLLIIIGVIVVVLIAGGAAAFLLMGGKDKKAHAKEEEAHEKEHAKVILVPFEEKFTVNLLSEDGSAHYLQIQKLELEVANADVAHQVEELKSKISDRISSLLRQKSMKEMLEPGSDIKLKGELKKVINETLDVSPGAADKKGVKEVILPASFIVQ